MPRKPKTPDRLLREIQSVVGELNRLAAQPTAPGLEEYFKTARSDYGSLLRSLSANGRLTRQELLDLRDEVGEGVTFEPVVDGVGVAARPNWRPNFKTDEARWAYVIWSLAAVEGVPYRVFPCKHCGTLVVQLVKGAGRGRPRSEFCSRSHGNAYGQRLARFKQKLAAKERMNEQEERIKRQRRGNPARHK